MIVRKIALLTGSSGDPVDSQDVDYAIHCVEEMDEQEYASYLEARDTLLRFQADSRSWAMVHLNFFDFERFLDRMFTSWIAQDPRFDVDKAAWDVDRRILNLASSYAAHFEHLKARYKTRYGRQSKRSLDLENRLSSNDFPYRFVLRYRHHVVHVGQPVSRLTLNSRSIDENPMKLEFEMLVTISKSDLAQGRSSELKYMRSWPDQISLRPVLRDAMEWGSTLNKDELRKDIGDLEKAALTIMPLSEYWEGQVGTPCIVESEFDETDKWRQISPYQIAAIPVKPARVVLKLKKEIDQGDQGSQ